MTITPARWPTPFTPPWPAEALYYLAAAAAVLVGLCAAWLTVGNIPLVFVIAIAAVAAWLTVQAVVTYRWSRQTSPRP